MATDKPEDAEVLKLDEFEVVGPAGTDRAKAAAVDVLLNTGATRFCQQLSRVQQQTRNEVAAIIRIAMDAETADLRRQLAEAANDFVSIEKALNGESSDALCTLAQHAARIQGQLAAMKAENADLKARLAEAQEETGWRDNKIIDGKLGHCPRHDTYFLDEPCWACVNEAVAEARKAAEEQLEQKSRRIYQHGYEDGLRAYAWWKDSIQYVGTCGTTLEKAIGQAANAAIENAREIRRLAAQPAEAIGKPISRREAIAIAQATLERAEQERLEVDEQPAEEDAPVIIQPAKKTHHIKANVTIRPGNEERPRCIHHGGRNIGPPCVECDAEFAAQEEGEH